MSSATRKQHKLEATQEIFSAMCELSSNFFDDAMVLYESEREACFHASCSLVRALEGERILKRPQAPSTGSGQAVRPAESAAP